MPLYKEDIREEIFEDEAYRTQDLIMKTPRANWRISPSAVSSVQLPVATLQLDDLGLKRKLIVSECLADHKERKKPSLMNKISMGTQT